MLVTVLMYSIGEETCLLFFTNNFLYVPTIKIYDNAFGINLVPIFSFQYSYFASGLWCSDKGSDKQRPVKLL